MVTPYGRDALTGPALIRGAFWLAGCVVHPAKSTNTAISTTIAMPMQGYPKNGFMFTPDYLLRAVTV
jgi:hypothetical protein